MARSKKIVEEQTIGTTTNIQETNTVPQQVPTPEIPQPTPTEVLMQNLLTKIEVLEKKSADDSKTIEMLKEVADKGRVFNYESQRAEKKPIKVKLSIYNEQIIIGWRTLKDELIKHPTTGLTVGEKQEYELKLLNKDGTENTVLVSGYPSFSDARYTERVECEVVGKKEDYKGNIEFEVEIPNYGRKTLDSRFVN